MVTPVPTSSRGACAAVTPEFGCEPMLIAAATRADISGFHFGCDTAVYETASVCLKIHLMWPPSRRVDDAAQALCACVLGCDAQIF